MNNFLEKAKNIINFDFVLGKSGDKQQQKEEKIKFAYYLGCLLVILSCFMTILKASAFGFEKKISLINVNGQMGDGLIVILVIVALAISFYLKKFKPIVILVTSIIPLVYSFFLDFKINNLIRELGSFGRIQSGAGTIVLRIGSLIIFACASLYYLNENKKIK